MQLQQRILARDIEVLHRYAPDIRQIWADLGIRHDLGHM